MVLRRVLTFIVISLVMVLGVLSLKRWVIEGYEVPTTSMMPTFRPGDRVWVNKLAYYNTSPKRGDMVVFPHPTEGILYVKRVIGLPGERITVMGRRVYLNGKPVEEISAPDHTEPQVWGPAWPPEQAMAWASMPDTGARYRILLSKPSLATWRHSGTWKVSPGHVFVMGDARDDSSDSRSWGTVSLDAIVGRVVCRVDAGSRGQFSVSKRSNCDPDRPLQ